MKLHELNWKQHSCGMPGHRQAVVEFSNGYGASIVFGSSFYSNGVDTYELAVLRNGRLCYDTPITDDVLGRLTEDEVNDALAAIETLPAVEGGRR